MGGGLNTREPIDTNRLHQNPKVLTIMENFQWLGFFQKLVWFDDEMAMQFAMNLQNTEGQ